MRPIADDVVGGYNEFIDQQRQAPGDLTATLVEFNSLEPFHVIYSERPATRIYDLTREQYRPGGSTPLFDPVARLIGLIDRTDRAGVDQVVAIVTDGLKNTSREHTFADVTRLIAERTERGWAFVYLAAGFDAFEQGQRMRLDTVGQWKSDPDGVKNMWKDVGGNLISYRTKAELARAYARKKFLDQVEEEDRQ